MKKDAKIIVPRKKRLQELTPHVVNFRNSDFTYDQIAGILRTSKTTIARIMKGRPRTKEGLYSLRPNL